MRWQLGVSGAKLRVCSNNSWIISTDGLTGSGRGVVIVRRDVIVNQNSERVLGNPLTRAAVYVPAVPATADTPGEAP